MRLVLDDKLISCQPGQNLLLALLEAGEHPTGGGCLCFGGDCPHCLATVDGVSYVRTCQTRARPGMVVKRHPAKGAPPLPAIDSVGIESSVRYLFCDVCVILFGPDPAGEAAAREARAAGKTVICLDSEQGQEAVAIYAGPLVIARTEEEMLHLKVKEQIIVATGSAEIQPVVPGSALSGLMTSRAAEKLHAAGLDLGEVVVVGTPPTGVPHKLAEGELVRFEGSGGRVQTVVTTEGSYPCQTAVLGLGLHPRDQLALMGSDLAIPVTPVGEAAREADVPKCPGEGLICPCSGIKRADLEYTWASGFREMELIKRSTLAGTGACQGMTCLPYLRSFLQEKGGELQPRFTARPMTRQPTLGEIAAGAHHVPDLRTALHDEHLRQGARMERSGPWWRPWNYGDPLGEYWAVREGVSLMDVSTLGKMILSGPDALDFLERVYPTRVSTLKTGRSRYVLLLDERGYIFDDGLIAKESETRYSLTFTSSGSSHAEMWLRDWALGFGCDVRLLNQTYTLGAINVTGPLSGELLSQFTELPPFLGFADTEIAGVPCRIYRLSFTGELSYELHHPAQHSVELWRTLMRVGKPWGIRPHGLEVLDLLRLEKGHIIVHQDTDFDSTPRRVDHEWMVKMDKEFFLGRHALARTNSLELDKKLVGLEMEGEDVPVQGSSMYFGDRYAGFITSSAYSPALGKVVMMGQLFLFEGELPAEVKVDGRLARRVALPFYDKEGTRAQV